MMDADEEVLCGWTIYHRPLDYPRHYAVRMWQVVDDSCMVHYKLVAGLYDTLEEARMDIPPGALCFDRDATDDPVIVETWI